MTKAVVDHLIANMKKAGIVTKAAPWMVEGMGEKEMNVRYVGIRATDDWDSIFSEKDNLLLKFIIDRNTASFEFYVANKPPFTRVVTKYFSEHDKWEILLGEIRRKLNKDYQEYKDNAVSAGNWYTLIKPHIKL